MRKGKAIKVTVNGTLHESVVDSNMTLLDYLREELGLTGAKKGCDNGQCGSCTVLMNGKAIYACLTLAVQADQCHITTIEGLSEEGSLHPLQKSFIEEGAVQCGFCTPGMILSAKALLDENRTPTDGDIKEALSGNLCRCTGYVNIIKAVKKASSGGDTVDV